MHGNPAGYTLYNFARVRNASRTTPFGLSGLPAVRVLIPDTVSVRAWLIGAGVTRLNVGITVNTRQTGNDEVVWGEACDLERWCYISLCHIPNDITMVLPWYYNSITVVSCLEHHR